MDAEHSRGAVIKIYHNLLPEYNNHQNIPLKHSRWPFSSPLIFPDSSTIQTEFICDSIWRKVAGLLLALSPMTINRYLPRAIQHCTASEFFAAVGSRHRVDSHRPRSDPLQMRSSRGGHRRLKPSWGAGVARRAFEKATYRSFRNHSASKSL